MEKKLAGYIKSKWQSFAIGLIGLYFVFLAYIFTPSFVENYILPWMVLNVSLANIVEKLRLVVFITGFILILFGFITAKRSGSFSRSIDSDVRGIFNYKNIVIIISAFIILFISIHIIVKLVRSYVEFDASPFWPISNFLPQIPDWQHLFIAASIILIFYFSIKYLTRIQSRLFVLIFFSIFLVMSTNLLQIQGWEGKSLIKDKSWDAGFIVPVTGSSKNEYSYYNDAIKITDVGYFINSYEKMQPHLLVHAATHPPGALLTIYLLLKIFENPALISIMIGVISISFSMFFLYKILSIEFKEDISKYMTFLFILIPSMQIFYVATIDALISSFLLGFIFFYLRPRSSINMFGSLFFLFLASFLTFTSVFIIPVMVGYEFLIRKDFLRSGYIILGMGLIYAFINLIFGFNYINSFMLASGIENPYGFMLTSQPVNYLFTRIEGVLEIILYFGPLLTVLMVLGLYNKRNNSYLMTLAWLGILSLLAMLATGAFRTAETARAALFIYPFLIIPVASYLQNYNISLKERNILMYTVFAQTLLMQTFGFYYS